ncbi:hypothetical protein A3I56_02695 [Candidatus Roizmanbacteria bacterium RIFCSPLOWO2_02_FULL_43_10]|uniref:Uncharacterized protein n=1 Tax=Candidatus Roizmanbacteria bacterium RIFCSPLOWO2_02_FULL_43_10 TaxID=1802078 RepID=A0A1F7JUW2_9BACT|nr:MAG: hypothetical protein A3I56_02695 [Candidatus Roizmanbacteria bacterium RIFCSPLOWO2_02_FULL_43_10]
MKNQAGQVLLIVILLSTVLLTVGLSLIDITALDNKVTKIQEDASKARAAAEAGIEAALNDVSAESIDIGQILADSTISGTTTIELIEENAFTTPIISKDGQFTFYLTGYNPQTKTITAGTVDDDMTIERVLPTSAGYCSGDQAFAVEVTFISASTGVVGRYMIDECPLIEGSTDEYAFGAIIPTSSISPEPNVMIMRVIAPSNDFDGARLRITNSTEGAQWPAQGRTIIATAQAGASKVTKKIKLFQSFPQFPAEFFVTSN